jgi:carbon-monoxide dehydrogenase medium subunit
MIPPAFDYAAPGTLSEAIALLGQNPDAKILAGGHSLIPMMKFRLATPSLLIDIGQIEGLAYVREEGGFLKIGAMTREATLDHSPLIDARYPLLADATKMIADPVVRNMATVGGNLAHADPANDHPAVMLAYGASMIATGPSGTREIPISDFFVGPFTSALEAGEILTEIRIPAHKAGDGGCYMKIERKVGDYATAAVAVQLHLDARNRCDSAGIALTNLGLTPIKCTAAAQSLIGEALTDDVIKAAAQLAADVAEPQADYRGSEAYKRSLVKTLTVRAVRKAMERARN